MQSPQSFPAYYGTGIQSKEQPQSHANPLDFSYTQCRMQSPNYYNQNAMPNFMSMSQTSQVNGYNTESIPPFQHGQIAANQNTAASPVDHQNYFPNQEPSQNCSFHQYAWLKSTAPENWWHNTTSSKNDSFVFMFDAQTLDN